MGVQRDPVKELGSGSIWSSGLQPLGRWASRFPLTGLSCAVKWSGKNYPETLES